ncbi:MAG: FHA domain-containing protein, partial [Anaerolineales bacterium]
PANDGARPKLVITTGPQEGTEIPLITDSLTIGRATVSASWDIGLQDKAVSRPHAKIERKSDNRWVLTDLGSSNGTLLNNKLVTQPSDLQDGAVMLVGQTTILFRLSNA